MKWLKDIFQKKKPSDSVGCLSISDLETWLDEKCSDTESQKRLKDIYAQIENVAGNLAEDVKVLNSAVPNKETPPKLLKAGLAARESISSQMNSLSEKLTPPDEFEAANVRGYHSSLVKTLGNTVTMFGRSQRFVAAIFPKEAESIKSELNTLSHLLVELDREIGKRCEIVDEIKTAKELLQKLRKECAKISDLNSSVECKERTLIELRDGALNLSEGLKLMASSDVGREAQSLRIKINESRNELNQIEAQMAEMIAPLNKALARIVKQDASDRLSLSHRKAFELLSKSPAEALDNDITEPLLELKSKIDLLGIKDKKREKIAEQIDILAREKPLVALKANHSSVQKQIINLQELLQKSSLKILKLEEEHRQINDQIARFETELAKDKGHLVTLEERAAGDKAELLAKMEKLAGRPIEIEF